MQQALTRHLPRPLTQIKGNAVILLLLAAILLWFSFYANTAMAQIPFDPDTLTMETLEGYARDRNTDTSRDILGSLLGDFSDNPLSTVGSPTTVIGHLFFAFNVALFVIGVAFTIYTIIYSIAVSAHEGEVMGRRMSSLWVPIRYGSGILGMIPAFGGFSLAQALMMYFAIIGIGLANAMTTAAIDQTNSFDKLIPAPSLSSLGPNPIPSIDIDLGKHLFAMHICSQATGTYKRYLGLVESNTEVVVDKKGASVKGMINECGRVLIVDETGIFDKTLRLGGSIFEDYGNPVSYANAKAGFRVKAVDYALIAEAAKLSALQKRKSLDSLNNAIKPIAEKWYQNFFADDAATKAPQEMSYPLGDILGAVQREKDVHDKFVKDQLEKYDLDTVKTHSRNIMKAGGWTGLGSWFALFSEVNAALQSAAHASRFELTPMELSGSTLTQPAQEALYLLAGQREREEEKNYCWGTFGLLEKNAANNCTPAQSAYFFTLDTLIEGTGGGDLVNPIIASKNIGDWMLTVVGGVVSIAWLVDRFTSKETKKAIGQGDLSTSGNVTDDASKSAKNKGGISDQLGSVLLTLFMVLGLTFAVYIPFVPFLTWFSGLVSYFASVLEGLVAAQVWGFSHLSTDGEGMGQKADRGYMFILNMILRPALMVMGFFFASGILVFLGTFFINQISIATAVVQGNTFTGPFIMLGLTFVIGLGLLTLIQTVFNLIYEIPDRVIAWFGGGMEARMAKEMDRGIETGAKQAAQWSGGSVLGTMVAGAGRR